jgi:hypothetical protein
VLTLNGFAIYQSTIYLNAGQGFPLSSALKTLGCLKFEYEALSQTAAS